MNLQDKTVKELRELVKEMNIEAKGVWKMKKEELISLIEANQTTTEEVEATETTEVQNSEEVCEEYHNKEVKPRKPSSRVKRAVYLLNPENEIVEEFESQAEAVGFVVKEKYCNIGWAGHSLKTGKAFYQKDDLTFTKPQKNKGYHGIGYRLMYKIN